ncbi:hypothetical protein, partial [Methylorubrum populi]|uniref:hypothetical protein n=1 Tax=Methylorubrum populi TaxID=223967 RepID=UPI0023561B5E
MKRAPRSRQRHDLYAKYHDYDSEISDLLGECGVGQSGDHGAQAVFSRSSTNRLSDRRNASLTDVVEAPVRALVTRSI